MECLASLQKQLGDLVLHTFSEYKDKRVINRQVKNKIARDIFYMGYSIANKQAAKELEKILVPKTQPNSDTTHDVLVPPGDELQTLIQVVADLTTRLDCLENRLKVVESEKSELKQQLESHSQKQTTVTPVTQDQNPNNDEETDESSTSSEESSDDSSDHDITTTRVPDSPIRTGGSENFIFPKRHRRKKARKSKRLERNRQAMPQDNVKLGREIPTSKKPTILKAAVSKKRRDVYIGGVDAQHTAQDVTLFLEEIGIRNAEVCVLARRDNSSSFKMTVAAEDESRVLKNSNWPEGVTVRPFRQSLKPQNPPWQRHFNHKKRNEQRYRPPRFRQRGLEVEHSSENKVNTSNTTQSIPMDIESDQLSVCNDGHDRTHSQQWTEDYHYEQHPYYRDDTWQSRTKW